MDKFKGLFIKLGTQTGDMSYTIDKVKIIKVTSQENPTTGNGEGPSYTFAINFTIGNVKPLKEPQEFELIKNTCIKEGLTFWPLTDDEKEIKSADGLQLGVTGDGEKAQATIDLKFTVDRGKVNNSAGDVLKESDKFLKVFY